MKTILSLQKNNIPHRSNAKFFAARSLLLFVGCTILMQAKSQADKRLVLADQYFAAGEYFTAAGLYGQFLHPVAKSKTKSDFPLNSKKNTEGKTGQYINSTEILFKQAESYRMANYWTEASFLYKESFEKDPAKYSAALYWFAVCQRSIGNYAMAEEGINRFLKDYGVGHPYQQDAIKEQQTLQFIRTQLARPDSVLYHIRKINTPSDKGVFAPAVTNANQFMITSADAGVVATGSSPYRNRLFNSSLINGSLQNVAPVSFESIDSSLNQGTATMSINGNYLYLTQWKKENGKSVSFIYYSTKTNNGWSKPLALESVNQQGHNSKQPFCSTDGRYLFFASDRTGGLGNFDIWYAPLQPDGTTGTPVNAGNVLNTTGNEQAPFYHSDTRTLVFASDRMPGMGGYDLFTSKGWETEWKTPENMGHPINSSRDDVYFFTSGKGSILDKAFFSSDRGSECCLATYTVSKAAKRKMITGLIQDCKDNSPVESAGVILKDAAGKTLQAITDADGKYSFELADNADQHQLFVAKEKYAEKTADIIIEGSNEVDWLTDTLYNAALCIEKKLVIKMENVVTVFFDFDQSLVKDHGITQLDSIYNVLLEDSIATIQISGFTDGKGSVVYNKKLSDKRARACADYLIKKGIDAKRISFESFGACCPLEMELINGRDNPDGRSINRRALINISKD